MRRSAPCQRARCVAAGARARRRVCHAEEPAEERFMFAARTLPTYGYGYSGKESLSRHMPRAAAGGMHEERMPRLPR